MATASMCTRIIRGICQRNIYLLCNGTSKRFPSRQLTSATQTNSKESETSKETEAKSSKEESPPPPPDAGVEEQLAKAAEEFKAEKDSLVKQIEDIQDKYKRSLAETENVRQRMKKQIDDAKLFGIQGFCKDLLEVADILGKATECVPREELKDSNPHLKNLFDGLAMTDTQMKKVFTRHGLVTINPADGEKFDPNIHEALFEQPFPGKEPGTVAVVTKIGYMLHSRTIRPALVGVVKAT